MGDRLSAKHPNVKVDVSAYIREQWSERSRELQKVNVTHVDIILDLLDKLDYVGIRNKSWHIALYLRRMRH